MPTVVAIAGGSGGLGRAISYTLGKDARYEAIILGRNADPELEKESGCRVVAVDYTSTDSLVNLLDSNNVAVVISIMNSQGDNTPEFNLIEASDRSKTVKRFVANLWAPFTFNHPDVAANYPFAKMRLAPIERLKATSLEWTSAYIGLFMDYYTIGLPSHVFPAAGIIDIKENVAGIPGTGEKPADFTYSYDVGKFVAELLTLEKWERLYHFASDRRTWPEVLALAEKYKGVKFDVHFDSIEDLNKGKVTEMPSNIALYSRMGQGDAAVGEAILKGAMAKISLWQAEGLSSKWEGESLNEVFPNIETMTFEKAWETYYQG